MEALIIAVIAGLNLIVVYWELEKRRFTTAALDISALVTLSVMFGQSTGGMVIATISSAMLSLFLLIKKPKLPITLDSLDTDTFIREFRSRLPQ